MTSFIMAPGNGSQPGNQPSLRAKHEHWRQEWIRNNHDSARAFNEATKINDTRDTILEVCPLVQRDASGNNTYANTQELLTKIEELEHKQQTEV